MAWDDPIADWSAFDLAVVRSTWDYTLRRDAFLARVSATAGRTRLCNNPDVLAWNTDKTYLRDLAATPFAAAEPLYARVDLIEGSDGRPLLLEIELVEPSMFLRYAPARAVSRFAAAITAAGQAEW